MTSAVSYLRLSLLSCFVVSMFSVCGICGAEYGKVNITYYREMVKTMFYHAYNGYIEHAYPYDELRPLTCDGHDTWGSYSLTLIDALDTLAVMGNDSEFRRVTHLLIDKAETFFDMDINVSVFETNIRVVGGLLSAHLLMKKTGMLLEPGWPCSGPLLRMAENIARKLLPAFDTATGMPYGTVNLRHGVPKGETTVTCTAGVGTFIVEFGALSRLTGDPVFEKVAMRAIRALWNHRSPINMLGNHVDVATGKWTALDSGIGGGVDSYFEYLVKGAFMFNIPELLEMFREYEKSIVKHVKRDDWYMWANMKKGGITLPLFTSLDAYWPGIQSMLGDVESAMKTVHNFHQVWRQFGSTPEFYNIPKAEVHQGREGYPLRPELIESIVYLYRATQDPFLLKAGADILEAIERISRTSCGYATMKDVRDHRLENRMESFFLAETTKYLYLLFSPHNFIHNNGSHGTLIHTPSGDCVLDAGGYVFNTEAHPIDLAAVHCCSARKTEQERELQRFHDNLNLLELLDLVQDSEARIVGKKLKRKRAAALRDTRPDEEDRHAQEAGEAVSQGGEKEEVIGEGGTGHEDKMQDQTDPEVTSPESLGQRNEALSQAIKVTYLSEKEIAEREGVIGKDKVAMEREREGGSGADSRVGLGERKPGIISKPAGPEGKVDSEAVPIVASSPHTSETREEKVESSLPQAEIKAVVTKSQMPETRTAEDVDSTDHQSHEETETTNKNEDTVSTESSSENKTSSETNNLKQTLDLAQKLLDLFSKATQPGQKKESDEPEERLPSMANLYAEVANYSIAYISKPEIMRCPAQPFHSRLSVWGEMFPDEASSDD